MLTNCTVAFPVGATKNLAIQQDLKHCSCKCSGITGSGAKTACGGLKFEEESVPMESVVAKAGAIEIEIAEVAKTRLRKVFDKVISFSMFLSFF